MCADAGRFFDDFGRPYHRQVFLSGGEHARGAYIDTVEFGFDPPLDAEARAGFRAVLESSIGAEALQRVAWPEEGRRVFIALDRGYYQLKALYEAVEAAGFSPMHRGAYYSGRLGRTEAPVGSRSEKKQGLSAQR